MTPLERAARAIALDEYPGGPVDDVWENYIPVARAVLEAIREPSEGMAEEAFRNGACGGHLDCWQAMIDAALKEG